MNKTNFWKLGFALFIVFISFILITPFDDRDLSEYALSQVTSEANETDHVGHETFGEVLENIKTQISDNQQIDYSILRSYGQSNRLNYAAYFEPPKGVVGTISSRLFPFFVKPGIRAAHVKDRNERNDLILRTLLRNSQSAIRKGLDLRGGVAFTMEITDVNQSMLETSSNGVSPMDKVVEIMNERLNAFGVAETMVRKKGDRSIEIQIPDTTTKQDPSLI